MVMIGLKNNVEPIMLIILILTENGLDFLGVPGIMGLNPEANIQVGVFMTQALVTTDLSCLLTYKS